MTGAKVSACIWLLSVFGLLRSILPSTEKSMPSALVIWHRCISICGYAPSTLSCIASYPQEPMAPLRLVRAPFKTGRMSVPVSVISPDTAPAQSYWNSFVQNDTKSERATSSRLTASCTPNGARRSMVPLKESMPTDNSFTTNRFPATTNCAIKSLTGR